MTPITALAAQHRSPSRAPTRQPAPRAFCQSTRPVPYRFADGGSRKQRRVPDPSALIALAQGNSHAPCTRRWLLKAGKGAACSKMGAQQQ